MSEGIAAGGEPWTYNPVTMFKMAFGDMQKYITARRMWNGLKDIDAVKFVRFGQKAPDGFVRVPDKITQVYFPAESGEGLVKAGEYWVEEGAGRLINRYLSRDMVREAAIGRGLLGLKNITTAMELGLSAFHLVFETLETAASSVGLGARELSYGVTHGNITSILSGVKEIAASPFSSFLTADRAGGAAIKYVDNPEAFLAEARGQKFIERYPEAANLIADLFTGGGKLAMSQDYKINSIRTFREAVAQNNYIGAAVRGIPALSELMMKPLFETYIPRLKIGMFLKEYSNAVNERASELNSGAMTRPELARRTWDFVEDRLGEMNFDNLFWDRSFKSAMQVLVRSVTWKLGNIRGFGKAFIEQGKEFKDAYDEGRLPTLAPEMGWALGVIALHATIGATMQYMMTGKKPEQLVDYFYPQIDSDGNRLSIPTYARDAFHLWHKPVGWVGASASGFISRALELWRNKDFFGVQVYDPEDSYTQNAVDMLVHMTPLPFSVSSMAKMREKGEPVGKQAMGFAGFTKAPYYIEQSEAQQKAYDLMGEAMPQRARTKEEFARASLVKQYANEYKQAMKKNDRNAEGEITERMSADAKAGKLNYADIDRFVKKVAAEPLASTVGRLDVRDALQVWKVATPPEKRQLAGVMAEKVIGLADRRPDEYMKMAPKINGLLAEIESMKRYTQAGGAK